MLPHGAKQWAERTKKLVYYFFYGMRYHPYSQPLFYALPCIIETKSSTQKEKEKELRAI